MKKKSALIFGLVLVILLSFSSGMVWGESKELPRVETACEGKAGVLLAKDEDNFSLIKNYVIKEKHSGITTKKSHR